MTVWQGRPPAMKDKQKAKDTLLQVKDILDKHGIEFWLLFGTCLGAIRDNDFIDIDFDIDLGIKHEILLPKLSILRDEFKSLGYDTKYLNEPYNYDRMLKIDNGIRVDLVDWKYWKGYRFHSVEPDGKCHLFPESMFLGMDKIKFLNAEFLVPTPVEDYLHIQYPMNWKEIDYDYDFRKGICLHREFWQKYYSI